MKREVYRAVEAYMLECMGDAAHDKSHVYRVLYNALNIAGEQQSAVDYDVLICACLLHDIGRREQFENPKLDHAAVGAEKAAAFLTANGFDEAFAARVSECIAAHRFRKDRQPTSIEAKILFDADKIDVIGAMGIARTLLYNGNANEPLYSLREDGAVSDGSEDNTPSFFQEYKFKLERLYDKFYTDAGKRIAAQRRAAAVDFYNALYSEACAAHNSGTITLNSLLEN